jgi:chromosome segregation ATPase
MHSRIGAIIHETQTLQKREIDQNKNNVNFSQNDLDKFTMRQDDEQKQLQRLQASIIQVNVSIARHYAQMHADSVYLQKLDLIKPQFLQTLDNTNANFAALSGHVSKLQNDEHKKFMQDILSRSQNQTVYDTRDLAQAFLAHYEKYKHVLRTDSTDYDRDISKLNELKERYASGQTVYFGLKAEVARLRDLLAALKKSVSASEADAALFAQLEQIISEILSAKKTRFAVDGTEKECAVSVLKSHVANGLV